MVKTAPGISHLAETVSDNGGVYFVPALTGLGAPHWDPYARGAIMGLTRGSSRAHIARAALEGIAFQVADVAQVMEQDSGRELESLQADGGASANHILMQIQADLLGVTIRCSQLAETTALGAAFMAGLAVGYWESQESLAALWKESRRFESKTNVEQREAALKKWRRSIERIRDYDRE